MTSGLLSNRFTWASFLAVGAAGLVGGCFDDVKATGHRIATAGEGGEPSGEGGTAGTRTTGGRSGAAVGGTNGEAGHGGESTGGSGAETGGIAGMGARGGRAGSTSSGGSGGKGMAGASGSAVGGTGEAGGEGGEAGGGGEGGSGPECENAPVVLARAPKAWAIAVEAGNVYYTTHDANGVVAWLPVTGGTPENVATAERYPHEVAVSNGVAYWVALGPQPGHLLRASVTGADRLELGTGVFNGMFSLSATASDVYYLTNLNVVSSVAVGGGTPTRISGGPFNSTVVDVVRQGANLFWTNSGVGTYVATQPETAAIVGADLGGTPTVYPLVSRLDAPQFQLTANDQNVFWSDEAAIYSTSRIGGTVTPIATLPAATSDESPVVDMVSDARFVFYTDGVALFRVPVAGGNAEMMTEGWDRITRLSIDDTSVYFTDYVRGAVVRVAKCATAVRAHHGEADNASGVSTASGLLRLAGAAREARPSTTASPPPCPHGCPEPAVAVSVPSAYGLALDDSYLYVSSYGATGSVNRAPLSGGALEPLSAEPYAHDIAVDDVNVYVCLADTGAGRLVKVPKAGGANAQLASGVGTYGVGRVVSDGTFAYFVTGFNALYRVFTGGVGVGGTQTVLAVGPYNSTVTDLAADDGEVFFVNDGIWNSTYTAKLPGTAYFGRAFVSGSTTLGHTTLKGGLDSPWYRMALDDANLYFIGGTSVYRRSRSGGDTLVLAPIAPASGIIQDMLSDGQHVYFADAHAVYRLPVGGGSVETLTSSWGALHSIAVNSTDLYFTDGTSGAVLKLPK